MSKYDHPSFGLDLNHSFPRRNALRLFAGAGAAAFLAACSSSGSDGSSATTATTGAPTTTNGGSNTTVAATEDGTCIPAVPEETSGPYPGDGSNGPDVLADPAVVREDITTSFGDYTGTAVGVPTTIKLRVFDAGNACGPLAGSAVYLWHADKDGHYSMYTAPKANYLRGVGEAAADGTVTFQTIWPGCYDGRWPHIHFEVYPSVDDALAAKNLLVTSQIALPEDACNVVYTAAGYESSVTNLTHTSLSRDMVFSDGVDQQLGVATGSNEAGWTVELSVSVATA